MKKERILAVIAIVGCITLLAGCGKKGDETVVTPEEQQVVEQQVTEFKVENPDELKIQVSEGAKKISNDVSFTNVAVSLNGGLTKVTGTVVNNTSKVITPYMNLNFVDESGNKVVTANAFADKVPANGSKDFQAKLTGDFSKYKVEVELAEVE